MAGPFYIADSEDAIRAVELDGLTAFFHLPSGMTHIVAPPAPEILAALRAGSATVEELLARLAERFELDEGGADEVEARLAELEQAGLVRRDFPPCEAKPHGEGDHRKHGGAAVGAEVGPSTALRAVPIATRQGR